MNVLKYILGFIANKICSLASYYRIENYKKKINGVNYRLGDEVCCNFPENISIGAGTYINGGELCASPNGKIIIGENCLISYDFFARTDVHNYIDKNVLIQKQGAHEKNIVIGNDVWIGFGVKIMAGVTVADGCVIAAGSVVTKNTEPYCLYAGNPAVKKKERK